MTPAICVTNLTITRGARTLLRQVSLSVKPGCRVLLTGQNGAGKSTLLCAIAGVLRTDGVQLYGQSNQLAAARSHLAWCAGGTRLPGAWTPRELLNLRRAQRGVAATAPELCGQHLLDQRIDSLSAGERQRVALQLALMGSPPIVLLDEPLEHLDEEGRAAVVAAVQRESQTTFLIATHRADDWKHGADRVLRLHDAMLEPA